MIVTSTPDIRVVDLDSSDSAVIVASDGLWDVLEDAEAAHIVDQVQKGGPKHVFNGLGTIHSI